MKKLFGTDGIRAVAGEAPLDPDTVRALGLALAALLREEGLEPDAIIGRDTRESGTWIEQAFVRGFKIGGGRAVSAGILPTSAISYLTRKHAFAAGIVLSASHNPYHDNGIKIFSAAGTKIPDDWEIRLEKALRAGKTAAPAVQGAARAELPFLEEYIRFLQDRFPESLRPGRMKVVLDCANGAGAVVAPRVFEGLGFEVIALSESPDGRNINLGCGSLHPEGMAAAVVENGASLGIAYDGDADRAVWADETGRILNGDHTLYVQALHMKGRGALRGDRVVATTMSNMGLAQALEKEGIGLVRTRVGDKYVLEEMIRRDANLGGERSGHTIFLDESPTGDGILTSLKMAEAIIARQVPLSGLVHAYTEFPQVLLNVPVRMKSAFAEFPEITMTVREIEAGLDGNGRIDLRYSGTEPLARIMIEGRDAQGIEEQARRLAEVVRKHLG
jgi:phosphoglucosamine mutase